MNKDELKTRLVDYLRAEGVEVKDGRAPPLIKCFAHDESNASMKVNVAEQTVHCFGCKWHGDVFKVAGHIHNLDRFADQLKKVADVLGVELDTNIYKGTSAKKVDKFQKKEEPKPRWVSLSEEQAEKIYNKEYFEGLATRNNWGKFTKGWLYRSAKGEIELIDVRFDKPDDKNIVSFWYDGERVQSKAPPVKLYNRDQLALHPDKPVLIVEGCKAAQAASVLDKFVTVTWNGGTGRVGNAQWGILKNRDVYIYPDDDRKTKPQTSELLPEYEQLGIKAALYIKEKRLSRAMIIEPPVKARTLKPSGADVVEALEVMTPEELTGYILNCDHENYYNRIIGEQIDYNTEEPDEELTEHIPVEDFHLTDMGNAKRFVAQHGDRVRYSPQKKMWLIWDARRWLWDEKEEILGLAKATAMEIYGEAGACGDETRRKAIAKHAYTSEAHTKLVSMVKLAQSEKTIPVLVKDLDSDPYLLCCQNGTLDLRNLELREHRPNDLITKMVACSYEPAAKSEPWKKFLFDVTGGDSALSAYLKRVIGYSLLGEVKEKMFWFLYGPPDGGKSTFIDAILDLFGDYARTTDFNTWLVQSYIGGNRGDIVSLLGARLVTSSEVRKGARFDEALIKKVTGNDRFMCAAKYEKEIEFRSTFSLLLAGNDAPTVRDDDLGMWARLRRIPFTHPVSPEKQDKNLRKKLRGSEVQSAILNWAIGGYRQYEEVGIDTCLSVEKSNDDYKKEMDRVESFFEDEIIFDPLAEVTSKSLRDVYENWTKGQGVKPLSGKEFNKRLKERGCTGARPNGRKGWRGIRIRTACDEFNDHEIETREENVESLF